jgi:hypothetical protein
LTLYTSQAVQGTSKTCGENSDLGALLRSNEPFCP